MKKIIYILIICGVLLGAILYCFRNTPKSTIKGFFNAIEQGEYNEALSFTTVTADSDYELYHAIMQKEHDSILSKGGIKKIELVSEEPLHTNQEQLTVTAIIHYGDGTTQEECCEMAKLDDEWKIVADLNAK